MTLRRGNFLAFLLVFVASGAAVAQAAPSREPAGDRAAKTLVTAKHHLVVAANPLAAQAGLDILREGGSAVDAAIAVQLVLNLVEPQSSGIGGGAFMLSWSAKDRKLTTYDGRETAPAAAKPDRFLGPDGKPLKFMDAVVGGKSVGVPGVLRLLEMAHQDAGKLPWARLFDPAIKLAEKGFSISRRLHAELADEKRLKQYEPARSYFYRADGTPKPVGTILKNPKLAATLRLVAQRGADAFYDGTVADDIVATVRQAPVNPGDITAGDLAGYHAKRRKPVCGPYRIYIVCGMGPPSSGGIAVLQILELLEPFTMAAPDPRHPKAVHLFAEAGRLAYADRDRYVADSDFVDVPVAGLTDEGYLLRRSGLIDPSRDMGHAKPGDPPRLGGVLQGDDASPEFPGTSHISIVDDDGNAVAMTTSIEAAFGSRLMVDGFLLNNELTDFSFLPERDGHPVANRVEPSKRPRSSMSPTMVFDDEGNLKMVIGSPGGPMIINYVAQTIIGVIDGGLDIQAAIDLLHVGNRNGPTEVEKGEGAQSLKSELQGLGHEVEIRKMTSGLHGIVVTKGGLEGGADPRREGVALGD